MLDKVPLVTYMNKNVPVREMTVKNQSLLDTLKVI